MLSHLFARLALRDSANETLGYVEAMLFMEDSIYLNMRLYFLSLEVCCLGNSQ